MGDRICVMKDGIIQQFDTPQVLYDTPDNLFVAGFIGSPQMNFLNAEIREEGANLYAVVTGEQEDKLLIPAEKCDALKPYIGKTVTLGIRPEHFMSEDKLTADNALTVKVDFREMLGSEYNFYLFVGENKVIMKVPSHEKMPEGDVIKVPVNLRLMHFFDKETEKAIVH